MKEKEMKKLDEKSEEKISGGTKSLEDLMIDPKVLKVLTYGGPLIRPAIAQIKPGKLYGKKKTEEGEKPEDALAPAKPVEPEILKK